MNNLPKDPAMLLSFVNMKLRDENITLEEFCKKYDVDMGNLKECLKRIDYEYQADTNQFI